MKHRTNCEKVIVATMKKRYLHKLFLVIAMIALLLLTLTGCGKQEAKNPLQGTTWFAVEVVDSDGVSHTDDINYTMKFDESDVVCDPDLIYDGFISGISEHYGYKYEDGKLSIGHALGDPLTIERYDGKVIEIRTPRDEFFRFVNEESAQSDTNDAQNGNPELDTNAGHLTGTVWTASRDDIMFEYRIEFFSDAECFVARMQEGNRIAVEQCRYNLDNDTLFIDSGMFSSISLDVSSFTVTTAGDGLIWIFRESDSPLSSDATREGLLRTVDHPDGNGSENGNADTGNATQNADGTWRYHILDHDWDLKVRIEDYIEGDEINLSAIEKALGYEGGKIRDADGNVLAETGETLYSSPYSTLYFGENWHTDSLLKFNISASNDLGSPVYHYTVGQHDCYVTKNQIVVVVYIWGIYNDGQVHEDPCIGILDDYGTNVDHIAKYKIP